MVVEIKRAVVESIGKLHLCTSSSTVELTPLRQERSKELTPHAADSIVGHSLALFVHLSTTSPSVRRCILEHALRWSSSPWHRCPITASSTNSADTSLLDRIPCVLSILLAGVATSFHEMHPPCHIGLVQLLPVCPRHSSSKFESGVDDIEPVQTV